MDPTIGHRIHASENPPTDSTGAPGFQPQWLGQIEVSDALQDRYEQLVRTFDLGHETTVAFLTSSSVHDILVAQHGLLRPTTRESSRPSLQRLPLHVMLRACYPTAPEQADMLVGV